MLFRSRLCNDKHIKQDWDYLQASNYFRFMTTKHNSVTMDRGIYESPYDAFTNYMNILGDFINRVHWALPPDMDIEELNALQTTIQNQDKKIQSLERQISRLKAVNESAKPSLKTETKPKTIKPKTIKPKRVKKPKDKSDSGGVIKVENKNEKNE